MLMLIRISMLVAALGLLAAGCSQQQDPYAPEQSKPIPQDKDGNEALGPPSIAIASGSGFAEGGIGMLGVLPGSATLNIDVPMGVTINQVLLYWSGGTTANDGDDTIAVDGAPFTGALIGGGTFFYGNYDFYAYRADITGGVAVVPGSNSFEISGMDFDFSLGPNDENNGVTMLVIYDDGTDADLDLRDGLDLAYWNFTGDLQVTTPQVFTFDPVSEDRVADMVIFSGSVGENRPNQIVVTTTAGDQEFNNVMGSTDGPLWDSLILQVNIPMDVSSLTVELISVPGVPPPHGGASMSWVGAGLSVPIPPPPESACIGDYVWEDLNMNGIQEMGEPGIEGVTVHLMDCDGNILAGTTTDVNGYYEFCELTPGDYNIHFVLEGGYVFSPQDQGMDDALDSDADPETGMTVCTNLEPGEIDHTWDAGMYMPPPTGCLIIIDEDGIDNDMYSIEQAAWGHSVEPDYLINDDMPTEIGNPPLRWNTMFPGDVVLLPTGEVEDEGWFALPENTPWSIEEFAAGTVPQDRLDKIPDVMPIRNQDLVLMVGRTCTAVVYDSDISMNYDPINANLQGARYGLFTFTVLGVEVPGALPEAQSSTSLYSVWVRVEEPQMPNANFEITVRDHKPDAIEINHARYRNGELKVFGESDFAPTAFMTITVDGPDMGSDLAIPPFLLEEPMTYHASSDQYKFIHPTEMNLSGRRVTISTAEGGSYTDYIE